MSPSESVPPLDRATIPAGSRVYKLQNVDALSQAWVIVHPENPPMILRLSFMGRLELSPITFEAGKPVDKLP